jgi:hypothetical protein
VRDAGLVELVPLGHEALARVKIQGSRLGVEVNFRLPAPLRLGHEDGEYRRPDPLVPPWPQDRHASDLAPGVQAPGTDYVTIFSLGDGVQAGVVKAVPFEFGRNLLFLYEDSLADPPDGGFVRRPAGEAHGNS